MKLTDKQISKLELALSERLESLKEDDGVSTSEFRVTLDLYSAVLDYKNPDSISNALRVLNEDTKLIREYRLLNSLPLDGYTILGLALQNHEDYQADFIQRFRLARELISNGADPVRQYGPHLDSPAIGFARLLPEFDGSQNSSLSNDVVNFFNIFTTRKESLLLVNNEGKNLGHILANKLKNLGKFIQTQSDAFDIEEGLGRKKLDDITAEREELASKAVHYTGYMLKLMKKVIEAGVNMDMPDAGNISPNNILNLFKKEMPDLLERVAVIESYNQFKPQERIMQITNTLREVGAFDDRYTSEKFDEDRKILEHWWGNNRYENFKDFREDIIKSFIMPLTRIHSVLDNNFMLLGIAKKINEHIQGAINKLPDYFSNREKMITRYADPIEIERPLIFDYVSQNLSETRKIGAEVKAFSDRKIDFHIQIKDSFTSFYESLNDLHTSIGSFKIFCDYVEQKDSEERARLLTPIEQHAFKMDRYAAPTYQPYVVSMKDSLAIFSRALEDLKTAVFEQGSDLNKEDLASGKNLEALSSLFDHSHALIDKVERTISLGKIKSLPSLRG